ncbi:MAG: FemAB family XrtA/PEP-CTERM system-associated protein [Thermodesulfobacteriota bacterium]
MDIVLYTEELEEKWDDYVLNSSEASGYHQIGWKRIIEETFGHKTFYLAALEDDRIKGIFPLVLVQSFLFGRYMVSLPFLNYGGICSDTGVVRRALLKEAIDIARREKAGHIEIRDTREIEMGLPVKESKVSMLLNLPDSCDELWKNFKSKLRSQIRRPEKEGMEARVGGIEELDDFYKVFAVNMRDLGTPVYTKGFFKRILTVFPDTTSLCVVYLKDVPVASGFLAGFKEVLEIPWASSLRLYNYASPNMMLYWNSLKYACEKRYKRFDFGRSTPDAGTYRFKKQWGAVPVQLYWYYWMANGERLPELNPQNRKFSLAIKAWQSLPVWLTKIIGPHIVKGLP